MCDCYVCIIIKHDLVFLFSYFELGIPTYLYIVILLWLNCGFKKTVNVFFGSASGGFHVLKKRSNI